jgi:hypothetical protein
MEDRSRVDLDVVMRIDRADQELIEAILAETSLEAERFEGAGSDGGGDLVTIILSLAGPILTSLVAILRARWSRARHATIEVDGVKIQAASPEDLERLLAKLLEDRNRRASGQSDHKES